MNDAPFWLSLSNSSSLVIDAPNDINVPGDYRFWLGIWEVTLEISAPCNTTYLQGLTEQGHVSVYVDKVVVLDVGFELDDKMNSWEKSCGSIERVFIYDTPRFVKFNEKRRKIEIKPEDKDDRGLHKILIELYIKSTKSFHLLEILVKLPFSYIDSDLVPFFWPGLEDELK